MSEPANPYLVELATAEDDEGYASSGYAESSIDVGTLMLSDDSNDEELAHTDAGMAVTSTISPNSIALREKLYRHFHDPGDMISLEIFQNNPTNK